jgi:hypothetical protein
MSPEAASSDELQTLIAELLQHVHGGASAFTWQDADTDDTFRPVIPDVRMSRYLH